jgi:hypothetical protein
MWRVPARYLIHPCGKRIVDERMFGCHAFAAPLPDAAYPAR